LIDTSAWLDLAARRDGQQWIVPLRVLRFHGKLELLVPSLVIEEFDRNLLRSEMAVTTSVLDRLRQLRRELRDYAGEKNEHIWLGETTQHIPLVNATAPQNFREIDALLHDGTIIKPTDQEQVRAAQRGLSTQPVVVHPGDVGHAGVEGRSLLRAARAIRVLGRPWRLIRCQWRALSWRGTDVRWLPFPGN
jgi:hypothetical protein